ncbi:hypothetical protein JCM10207_007037 [Rhodosporidiobolus poonsookiae]
MIPQLALALAGAAAVHAAVTPTGPGPNDVYRVGETCKINWDLDTTGTWTSFSITLKTGANLNMIELEEVVSGVDGTTGTGEYEWTCPDVTPNSKIYFYEFAQTGEETSWTTRFTIAAADGSTTDPTETDSNGIQWGTGSLASSSSGSGSSASSARSSSGPSRLSSTTSAASSASSAVVTGASSSSAASSDSSASDAETSTSESPSMVTLTSTMSSASSASSGSLAAASASQSSTQGNTGARSTAAGLALGFVGLVGALLA